MYKIIVQGDKTKAEKYFKEIKLFTCNVCDCKFEADKDSYERYSNQYDFYTLYKIKCPCCGNDVYLKE